MFTLSWFLLLQKTDSYMKLQLVPCHCYSDLIRLKYSPMHFTFPHSVCNISYGVGQFKKYLCRLNASCPNTHCISYFQAWSSAMGSPGHHVTEFLIERNSLWSTYMNLKPLVHTCSLHLQLSGSTHRHGIHRSPCHWISHRVEHFIEYLCRLHASYLYLLIASPTFRLDRWPWDPPVTMSPDF